MSRIRLMMLCFVIALLMNSCGKHGRDMGLKDVVITIDWAPVAEYYGIYYAKESGIFKSYGYNVTIQLQNGAPVVANLVGSGVIPIGTTTSDNILRSYANDHRYSAVRKLFNYNPSSIITLEKHNIKTIDDLRGKKLGVNPVSSPYFQFKNLVETNRDIKIDMDDFYENPSIGWGGAEVLLNNTVDAILAYTTNQALDVKSKDSTMCEIFLGDYGVYSYGLVLAFADAGTLQKYNIDKNDIKKIYEAIAEGYEKGYEDIENTVTYLKMAEPTLKEEKLKEGIKKIGILNTRVRYPHYYVDQWLIGGEITEEIRDEVLQLYGTVVWKDK